MFSSSASFRTNLSPLNEETALGILNHLNKDELRKMLDDNSNLEQLIQDDQQVKRIETTKENLITSNRSVAEYNLSQEPRLASAKQLLSKLYDEGTEAQKEYDEKKQKLDYHSSQYNLDTICALLQTEAAKSDEHSENVADSFLNGELEVEAFMDQYVSERTIAHQRKTKAEKMVELVRSGATSTAGMVAPPSGYPQNPSPYPAAQPSTWAAPYPNAMAMPSAAAYLPR